MTCFNMKKIDGVTLLRLKRDFKYLVLFQHFSKTLDAVDICVRMFTFRTLPTFFLLYLYVCFVLLPFSLLFFGSGGDRFAIYVFMHLRCRILVLTSNGLASLVNVVTILELDFSLLLYKHKV